MEQQILHKQQSSIEMFIERKFCQALKDLDTLQLFSIINILQNP